MLMDADAGEGGVKIQPKIADVVYGRSLCQNDSSRKIYNVVLKSSFDSPALKL